MTRRTGRVRTNTAGTFERRNDMSEFQIDKDEVLETFVDTNWDGVQSLSERGEIIADLIAERVLETITSRLKNGNDEERNG